MSWVPIVEPVDAWVEAGGETEPWVERAGALAFDGVDDFGVVAASAGLDTPTAFSIEAWIKDLDDGQNWHSINRDNEAPSTERIWIVRRDTDTAGNYHVWNSASALRQFVPANSWKINEWFHFIFTCWIDGGNVNLEVFINGASVGTDFFAGTAIKADSSLPIRFSRRPTEGFFKKQALSRVRYYSRRIEAIEAAEHYNGVFNNDTGLIGRWDFNEGAGTVANDLSGNSNHATLQGKPVWSGSLWVPS